MDSLAEHGSADQHSRNRHLPWLGYDGRTLYLNSTWDGLVGGKEGATWIWAIRHSKEF